MKNKSNKVEQQVSITVQTALANRDGMKATAYEVGLRRIEDGKEVGNVSGIFNLYIAYVNDTKVQFAQWFKDRILKSMKSE